MLKLALRNLNRSKWQTFLLIFGITVTVALEAGIVVTVDTIFEDFLLSNRNQNFTDITVNPKEFTDLTSLRGLSEVIESIEGVSQASEVYSLSSDLIQNQTGSWINILILGIDDKTHPDMAILNITSGVRKVEGLSILISQSITDSLGITLGETLVLDERPEIGFEGVELEIGGIFSIPPFFGNKEEPLMILIDIDTILTLFQEPFLFSNLKSFLDVKVNNLVNLKKVANNIKDIIGPKYDVFTEKSISELQALGITAYSVAMNLVVIASLLVEFLFTTNILTIAIRERQKEYGILRTLGISSKGLLTVILYEVLIYSIIGSFLGIIVGIGFSNLLTGILDEFYSTFSSQVLTIKASSLAIVFLSGILISLLAGIYPIYLALRVPVVQNIHSRTKATGMSLLRSYWKFSIFFGIIFAISGYLLSLIIGPAQFLEYSISSGHFVVIAFIFFGSLLIEAGLLVFLPKIGEKTLIIFNQASRKISMRNISREFQKSLFTIMTLSVALAFIIFVGIVSNVVIHSFPQYYEGQWGSADLVIETKDNNLLPTNFTDDLISNEMISHSAFIQKSRTEVGSINTYVFGVDPVQYGFFRELAFDSIIDIESHLLLQENTSSTINVLVSDNLFKSLNTPLGGKISVKFTYSTLNVTIAAIIKGNSFLENGRYLYIDSIYYQQLFNTSLAKMFVCDVDNNVDIAKARENISLSYPALHEVIGVDIYRNIIEDNLRFQANLLQVLFLQSLILAGIAQFVGILISTIHMEREMGIMRSVGLSKMEVFNVFLAESSALGITALVFGLLEGIFGSFLILWYISQSIPVTTTLPFNQIIEWVVIMLAFTLLSAIIPAFRSSQKDIVDTIYTRPITPLTRKLVKKINLKIIIRRILIYLGYLALIVCAYFAFIYFFLFLVGVF
ncbi:MAG: FtsX-like permease family protein [Asgard group archaeon]|nr:FtsX-like permease family protein [Asgard group archaeon]